MGPIYVFVALLGYAAWWAVCYAALDVAIVLAFAALVPATVIAVVVAVAAFPAFQRRGGQ